MDARGLLGFRWGQTRRGFLNLNLSCPLGLGTRIVDFLRDYIVDNEANRLHMLRQTRALHWPPYWEDTPPLLRDRYRPYAGPHDPPDDFYDLRHWRYLLCSARNGTCLMEIFRGALQHLSDDTQFMSAHPYECVWAWFLDFETSELEVWKHGVLIMVVAFRTLSWIWMDELDYFACKASHGEFERGIQQRRARQRSELNGYRRTLMDSQSIATDNDPAMIMRRLAFGMASWAPPSYAAMLAPPPSSSSQEDLSPLSRDSMFG